MKRVAVIGAGYWGKNLVRVFDQLGALRLVVDSKRAALEQLQLGSRECQLRTEAASAFSDPAIDAVVIATPAATHAELAGRALDAGKDVFVEKPLALTVGDAERLVGLATSQQRILMVGHVLRFHPAVTRLLQLVRSGELGKLQYLYSNRLNIGRFRTEENILWSFAPHDISVILAILGELPATASCQGGAYLSPEVSDVTVSQLAFPSGVRAHVFVSWLHPFKEQRLVVVGSEKMAVFDESAPDKLVLYPHKVTWKDRAPTALKADAQPVPIDATEPLKAECEHFLYCLDSRTAPLTDGGEALAVLTCLDACQRSLALGGVPVPFSPARPASRGFFVHESAYVDEGAQVGAGSKIWHFSHVMSGARIGKGCILGQNVNVAGGSEIGDNVKIQNNVSVYTGVVVEDDVFLGPSCVLTNVTNPRSQVNRHALYERTVLKRGCSIGANATILCGVTVGRYAFVAAGAVVTRDLPDYALAVGNPARRRGWMSRHGHRLGEPDADGTMRCPESGYRYREVEPGRLRCLDLDEEAPLPIELSQGSRTYAEVRGAAARVGVSQVQG